MLFVGCHTGDQVTHTWRIPPIDTPVVQIDIDGAELGRSYPDTLGLMGDPKATLQKLVAAIGRPSRDSAYADRAAGIVATWRETMAPLFASGEAPIRVERLCAEITRALPQDGILVADTGYSGIWSSTCIEMNGAGQQYLRAAGSLGWSFPASLGAKCAGRRAQGGLLHRRRRALLPSAGAGDRPAARHRRRSGGQQQFRLSARAGRAPAASRATGRATRASSCCSAQPISPTWRAISACGASAWSSPTEIAPALRDALAADETVVVDVATALEPRAPEPWTPPA